MKTYSKKHHPIAKVELAKGISMLIDTEIKDEKELMVAIGILAQMIALNHQENDKEFDAGKIKEMLNLYIDKVVE